VGPAEGANSLYFSLLTGNSHGEKSSPTPASTASQSGPFSLRPALAKEHLVCSSLRAENQQIPWR
jgi:hypothetical protein